MRRGAALLGLVLALLLASCSGRERANPLDAANPRSGGAPEGFNAVAGFVSVRIAWTARPDLAIDGFRLYRLAPFDSLYRPLGAVMPLTSSQYFDAAVSDGLDYRYRLHYVTQGATSGRYAEDVATPGRVRAWVVDAAGGRLIQLSPDARDVVTIRSGYGSPYSLAVTPDFGPLWVADYLGGDVRIHDPQNFTGPLVTGIPQPFTMALDPQDGSAWICDLAGSVRHVAPDGSPGIPSALTLLLQPSGIATDAFDGDVWVTELEGNRVRRYASDGVPFGARVLDSPSRVAVDSLTGDGWVTSFATGWVWRLSENLVVQDSLRLQGPIGLALDWRRRTAWVMDALANEIVALDMDTRTVRFRFGGLGEPRDAAVDLDRGECWIVGRTAGTVYRFSPTGVPLAQIGGLGNPHEVRLDRGYR